MPESNTYKPEYLRRWTVPNNYAGEVWPDYYSAGVGQSRDSDALERSNFRAMLKALGGESETVRVVRESHWAVGWVEWIAIHQDDSEAFAKADEEAARLKDYPVLDEDDFSREEMEEADQVWSNCYDIRERVDYMREHRSQFDFR